MSEGVLAFILTLLGRPIMIMIFCQLELVFSDRSTRALAAPREVPLRSSCPSTLVSLTTTEAIICCISVLHACTVQMIFYVFGSILWYLKQCSVIILEWTTMTCPLLLHISTLHILALLTTTSPPHPI
jgi:hypothetical protein